MIPTEPAKPRRRSKRSRVTVFFLKGLVTLLPVLLTVFVLVTIYNFVTSSVTGPINGLIYWSIERNAIGWQALRMVEVEPYAKEFLDPDVLPLELREMWQRQGSDSSAFQVVLTKHRDEQEGFFRDLEKLGVHREKLRAVVQRKVPPFLGVLLSLSLVLWIGWVVGGFFGRRATRIVDRTLNAIPFVRSIYPYSKQLVEFFFAESKLEFQAVVAAPYPSVGVFSIGFVTNNGLATIRRTTEKDFVAVFVPSSPMPMTGYTVFLESHRLIPLPITVDEALRIVVSGGVLLPPAETLALVEDPPSGPETPAADLPPKPCEELG